ncbi:MAG: sulfotransferase family 2 domain-containing protein [Verrucomicrobiota bacterium]
MIISHRHKFIFIKTHKTAGSSLEMALGALCGPEDIISSMETNDDSGIPRNYYANHFWGRLYQRSKFTRKWIHRHSRLIQPWYYEHMPAWRIREQVGTDIWDSYYKFCFERNPWEKVVSYYFWKKYGQNKTLPGFEEYVLKKTHRLPADAKLYCDKDGNCLVDQVYDFRNLNSEIASVYERIGLRFDGRLPKEKTEIKTDRKHYSHYYTESTKAKVAEVFETEIMLHNYSFETAPA